jgi:hypothetical protein
MFTHEKNVPTYGKIKDDPVTFAIKPLMPLSLEDANEMLVKDAEDADVGPIEFKCTKF